MPPRNVLQGDVSEWHLSVKHLNPKQLKTSFIEPENNQTDRQICSISKDEKSGKDWRTVSLDRFKDRPLSVRWILRLENVIYEAMNYTDAFLFQKPDMANVNGMDSEKVMLRVPLRMPTSAHFRSWVYGS